MRKEKRINFGAKILNISWTSPNPLISRSSSKRKEVRSSRVSPLASPWLKPLVQRLLLQPKLLPAKLEMDRRCCRVCQWMAWRMLRLYEQMWSRNVEKTFQSFSRLNSWTLRESCRSWRANGMLNRVTRVTNMPLSTHSTSPRKAHSLLCRAWWRKNSQVTLHWPVSYSNILLFKLLLPLVFSSQHVDIQMLEESRNAVISGKWTDKSAGGCHLYHKSFEQKADKFTWTTNPRFHLKLQIEPNQ